MITKKASDMKAMNDDHAAMILITVKVRNISVLVLHDGNEEIDSRFSSSRSCRKDRLLKEKSDSASTNIN